MSPKSSEFPRKGLSAAGPNENEKLFNRLVDFLDSLLHQEGAVVLHTLSTPLLKFSGNSAHISDCQRPLDVQ